MGTTYILFTTCNNCESPFLVTIPKGTGRILSFSGMANRQTGWPLGRCRQISCKRSSNMTYAHIEVELKEASFRLGHNNISNKFMFLPFWLSWSRRRNKPRPQQWLLPRPPGESRRTRPFATKTRGAIGDTVPAWCGEKKHPAIHFCSYTLYTSRFIMLPPFYFFKPRRHIWFIIFSQKSLSVMINGFANPCKQSRLVKNTAPCYFRLSLSYDILAKLGELQTAVELFQFGRNMEFSIVAINSR